MIYQMFSIMGKRNTLAYKMQREKVSCFPLKENLVGFLLLREIISFVQFLEIENMHYTLLFLLISLVCVLIVNNFVVMWKKKIWIWIGTFLVVVLLIFVGHLGIVLFEFEFLILGTEFNLYFVFQYLYLEKSW